MIKGEQAVHETPFDGASAMMFSTTWESGDLLPGYTEQIMTAMFLGTSDSVRRFILLRRRFCFFDFCALYFKDFRTFDRGTHQIDQKSVGMGKNLCLGVLLRHIQFDEEIIFWAFKKGSLFSVYSPDLS